MDKKQGKKQSYSREYNLQLVISCLKNGPKSASDLFKELDLSNATMYNILNSLEEKGLIIANKDNELKNTAGRRQVIYSLNEDYGYILAYHIANFQIDIVLYNMKEEIIAKKTYTEYHYSRDVIYNGMIESSQMCLNEKVKNIPLRAIVISLPGRINKQTNKLVLSKTFDENVIEDQSFIGDLFSKLFPNVPRYYYHYTDILALAEMHKGCLVNQHNAVYINVDYRLGGSFIVDGVPFEGDRGLSGEIANFKVLYGKERDYLKKFISFEYLMEDVSKLIDKKVNNADELIALYHSNKDVKDFICKQVDILGRVLANLAEWFDITNIVIGGRSVYFDEDYLNAIKEPMSHLDFVPNVMFATLGDEAKHIGAAKVGVDKIIKQN